jgi:DNA-binding LacI/PurR family transcriptional regulator
VARAASTTVTIVDVARRAGVSKSTASRALAGEGRVSPGALERVARAAVELSFVPNPAARALVTTRGTRLVVGVVSPGPTLAVDAYLGRVISAAASLCEPERIGVGLQAFPLTGPNPLPALMSDPTVQGVVLVNTTEALLQAVQPDFAGRVVSIGIGSVFVPSVDVDNGAGSAAVVRHLVKSGRRRIVMITGPHWLPCARRSVRAYTDVVRAAGLTTRIVRGDFTAESGRIATMAALRRWPDLDAVVAICDATALGAIAELRSRSIAVPSDVAVVGFDDIPFAEFAGLTTATHPVERIAEAATRAVLESRPRRPDDIVFSSDLVLRQSA